MCLNSIFQKSEKNIENKDKEKIGDMFTITVQNYGTFVVSQDNYESLKIGDEVRL